AGLDEVMRWAASRAEERASSQIGLFGGGGGEARPPPLPAVASWGAEEELAAEREAIGFFITGHPLDRYEQDLRKFTTATTGTLRTRGRELPPGDGERNGRPDTRPPAPTPSRSARCTCGSRSPASGAMRSPS